MEHFKKSCYQEEQRQAAIRWISPVNILAERHTASFQLCTAQFDLMLQINQISVQINSDVKLYTFTHNFTQQTIVYQ